MKEIKIIDTTLRDAHQCLWATRMTTPMMASAASYYNDIGFDSIDLMGMIQFDVCVRYLKENPWERIRLLKRLIPDIPFKGGVRSKSLISFDIVPDDAVKLMVEKMVENGLEKIMAFDALFDMDNIVETLNTAKKCGAKTSAALVFSESPVHTDDLYVSKTKELIRRADVDYIKIKDSSGLLTPDRVKELVPKMKKVMGDIQLELHSHCMTGLAPLVYLEGVKAGADCIDTAIPPLANGASQPSTLTMIRNLRSFGYKVNIDDSLVEKISDYFTKVAEQEGKPVGVPMEYDAFHYEHQMPGGMLTNLHYQLEEAGISGKFDQVLHEIKQIRRELAWPIMVTPFAQLIGTQAVLNVIHGERYRIVPDEVKKYALGYYGKLLAPIDPNVMDRIIENGSKNIALERESLSPVVPELRKKYPNATDEERLLRFMISGSHVDDMLAKGHVSSDYSITQIPIIKMIKYITSKPDLGQVYFENSSFKIKLHGGE